MEGSGVARTRIARYRGLHYAPKRFRRGWRQLLSVSGRVRKRGPDRRVASVRPEQGVGSPLVWGVHAGHRCDYLLYCFLDSDGICSPIAS